MIEKGNNILNEPTTSWGGSWTEKKLNAFAKYVSAYLTIMKKNSYWKTIYFDGFAGSGHRSENTESDLYKQLSLTIEDERVYKGAAERVLSLDNNLSFDFHYFIDSNEESLRKLEVKLEKFQKGRTPFQYRPGDCNQKLFELSAALKDKKKKLAALVLLDPFGMQINWDAIASLKDTKSDIWILIPTGVIVNRLLDNKCELKSSPLLQSFFGLSEDEIKKEFYRKHTLPTLFGEEDEIIKKISKPIQQISKVYIKQLKTIWEHVTEEQLILYNTHCVPIFHFVFASNNIFATKIAKDIIKNI